MIHYSNYEAQLIEGDPSQMQESAGDGGDRSDESPWRRQGTRVLRFAQDDRLGELHSL
jgi:hypothetical protein